MSPSSMKIEFREQADLKQACYEATVDLVRYIEHLKGIAARCRKNFPEVANGLEGSAHGIGQYLRGVDGSWKSRMSEDLKGLLQTPDFESHLWAYEFSRDPRCALLLLGGMAAVASVQPELRFWDTLAETRKRLSNLEPLIERLLASSPLRSSS